MSFVHINHNPSRRELGWFGLIWLIFFSVVSWSVYRRSGSTVAGEMLLAWSIIVPVVGWIWPEFMRVFYLGMCYAGFPIGFVVQFIVMAVVYFLVITPLGWLLRLFGHDPMHKRFEPDSASHWTLRPKPPKVDQYFRQF